jgi:hypothetical protein
MAIMLAMELQVKFEAVMDSNWPLNTTKAGAALAPGKA